MPKVSIVTPCYKAEKFIGRTIESVFAQTFTNWEHVVVDDGSPDGSAEITVAYAAREPRLKLLRQPNGGMENARNSGLAACSADSNYFLFLDADDCLEPAALETLAGYLDAHAEVGMVYCAFTKIDADDRPLVEDNQDEGSIRFVPTRFGLRRLRDSEPETPLEALASYFQAIPSSCLFRRTVYEQTEGWDERFRVSARSDNDMGLKCALLAPVHYYPEPLVRYRLHGGNASLTLTSRDAGGLERKWRTDPNLAPAQAERVRRAFNFDYLVTSHLQLHGAWEEAGRGHYAKAFRFCLQGMKKIAQFLILQVVRKRVF